MPPLQSMLHGYYFWPPGVEAKVDRVFFADVNTKWDEEALAAFARELQTSDNKVGVQEPLWGETTHEWDKAE